MFGTMATRGMTLERARAEIAGHVADGVAWPHFGHAVADVISRAIPNDGIVVATTDPATGLLTDMARQQVDDSADELFMQIELTHRDPISLMTLAAKESGTGILSDHLGSDPVSSPRVREFLRPCFDLEQEMRGVFRIGGRTWAAVGIYRARRMSGFTHDDTHLISSLEDNIAAGVRQAQLPRRRSIGDTPSGASVLLLDEDFELTDATAVASERLSLIGNRPGGSLPTAIRMAATAARVGADSQTPALARVRATDGRWFVIEAASVSSTPGAERFAVTIQPADAHHTLELACDLYGLTTRERMVVAGAVAGADTRRIANELGISPYTVQDHLKSVFAKTDVTSRSELVALMTAARATAH